jgi:Domain of unknown function (DUF5069)
MVGGYAFLGRVADKVRAEHAGTAGEYIGYCPFSLGFLERVGVTKDEFDALIRQGASDAELVDLCNQKCPSEAQREAANKWVLETMKGHLDAQDAEEGRL